MSESLAVFIWIAIASVGFAAGLIGISSTRRRLADEQGLLATSRSAQPAAEPAALQARPATVAA